MQDFDANEIRNCSTAGKIWIYIGVFFKKVCSTQLVDWFMCLHGVKKGLTIVAAVVL